MDFQFRTRKSFCDTGAQRKGAWRFKEKVGSNMGVTLYIIKRVRFRKNDWEGSIRVGSNRNLITSNLQDLQVALGSGAKKKPGSQFSAPETGPKMNPPPSPQKNAVNLPSFSSSLAQWRWPSKHQGPWLEEDLKGDDGGMGVIGCHCANKQTNKQTNKQVWTSAKRKCHQLGMTKTTQIMRSSVRVNHERCQQACPEVPRTYKLPENSWNLIYKIPWALQKNWAIVMSGVLAQCFRMFPSIRKQFAYSCSW